MCAKRFQWAIACGQASAAHGLCARLCVLSPPVFQQHLLRALGPAALLASHCSQASVWPLESQERQSYRYFGDRLPTTFQSTKYSAHGNPSEVVYEFLQ